MPESNGKTTSGGGTQPELVRQLGLFDSTMLTVGIVIGEGIFISPNVVATYLPSPGWILLAWFVGGLLMLFGALTFAELGAAMPEAGGQYAFFRKAFGPLAGFLFGWVFFAVYYNGVIAYMSISFARYLGAFFPKLRTDEIIFTQTIATFGQPWEYSLSVGQIVAVGLIAFLSTIGFLGVRFGKAVQNSVTVVKIAVIMVFIVAGLTIKVETPIDLSLNLGGIGLGELMMGFGLALIPASIAFDGWHCLMFMGSEVKNPGKNVTRALFIGTAIISIVYLLMNLVYLRALSLDELAASTKVAEDAGLALYGEGAASIISAAVVVSIFGALNGIMLAGPRIYYAMARDGLFFQKAAQVHPRFKTPGFAILIQAVWASVLTLSGSVEQLMMFVMVAGISFWAITAVALLVLRRKHPDMPRPYKTWGYPFVPIIFILASVGILANTLNGKPYESFTAIGITLLGVPVYYAWRRFSKRAAA